jgi:hypothetical protein
MLARAWVRVSRSKLDGIDQSADTFWSNVKAQFDANSSGDEERTAKSMKSRRNSTLCPNVSRFLNSKMYLERLSPTGASAGDRMQMVIRHFSGARYDDKGEIGVLNHCCATSDACYCLLLVLRGESCCIQFGVSLWRPGHVVDTCPQRSLCCLVGHKATASHIDVWVQDLVDPSCNLIGS